MHIRLLDMILVGMNYTANNVGYDLDIDSDYIAFVSDMTAMESEGIEYFNNEFIDRLSSIQERIDEILKAKREKNKVL